LKILDKNREQIFENSKDINEQAIGFYSYATEVIKGRKKKGEPFDGKDTGELFNQMYMQEVSEFSLVLNLHYADILKSKSWLSKDIFGLTDKT
jgi:hypothetical protein